MNEFDTFIETVPGICFFVDYELNIKSVNLQVVNILNRSRQSLIGTNLSELPFENLNQYFENLEILKDRDVNIIDNILQIDKKKSIRFYVEKNRLLKSYFVLGIDISNDVYREVVSRSIEQEQDENERFLLIGKMATQIAHEINNPLSIIAGHLSKLKRNFENVDGVNYDQKLLESVVKSQSNIDRIALIVKSLSVSGVKSDDVLGSRCSVVKILDDALKMCDEIIVANNIIIKNVAFEENIWIKGDELKYIQVLQSLILNSVDAVKNIDNKWISFSICVENNLVVLSITDSGEGVPSSIRDQIFRPFFSTKNKGIGVGLSNAKMILKDFHADVVYDTNSINTKFDLYYNLA